MKAATYATLNVLVIVMLTIVSEVGGGIYLVTLILSIFLGKKFGKYKYLFSLTTFGTLWIISFLWFVPFLAEKYNRVPLPVYASANAPLRPVSIIFPVLFRNYVSPTLKKELIRTALIIHKKYGRNIVYLDACFPLGKKVPLLPHLSHDDGQKVDLAFFYKNKENDLPAPPPSPIGYWVYSPPLSGEFQPCKKTKSFLRWDMNFMQSFSKNAILDTEQTANILVELLESKTVHKIFLEPHLKQRLQINDSRIRFQGCNAARHDDHLHVQGMY